MFRKVLPVPAKGDTLLIKPFEHAPPVNRLAFSTPAATSMMCHPRSRERASKPRNPLAAHVPPGLAKDQKFNPSRKVETATSAQLLRFGIRWALVRRSRMSPTAR
jgi:hypothetical protein